MADVSELFEPAELLAQVDKAIASILTGGQSYRIGNRSLTRADLAMLKNMRNDLLAQAQSEDNGQLFGRTYAAFFDGR